MSFSTLIFLDYFPKEIIPQRTVGDLSLLYLNFHSFWCEKLAFIITPERITSRSLHENLEFTPLLWSGMSSTLKAFDKL